MIYYLCFLFHFVLFFLFLELLLFTYWTSSSGLSRFLILPVLHFLVFFLYFLESSLISFSVVSSFHAYAYPLGTYIFTSPAWSSNCQHPATVGPGDFYGDSLLLGFSEQQAINTEELFCLGNSFQLITD